MRLTSIFSIVLLLSASASLFAQEWIEFASRVPDGEARKYSIAAQPTLLLGPFRKVVTVYGLLSPVGGGIERSHDVEWRGFYSAFVGGGISLREGGRTNLNLEGGYFIRTGHRGERQRFATPALHRVGVGAPLEETGGEHVDDRGADQHGSALGTQRPRRPQSLAASCRSEACWTTRW